MKVLMTGDTVGGVWSYAMELIAALAAYDVEVALATMGGYPSAAQLEEARQLDNLTLHASEYRLEWMHQPWNDVEAASDWLLELRDHFNPDVVHLNGYAHAVCDWQRPVVVTAHSCVYSWWKAVHGGDPPAHWNRYREVVRAGLSRADVVIAPTSAMLHDLQQHYGPIDRASVIPNGRSPHRFMPRPKAPFILTAGRLWDKAKNIAALDYAAANLRWPIYVAGPIDHPDEKRDAVKPQHVRLLGPLANDKLQSWLGEADIYAMPARYEPFGLSILEAALAGCSLVLSDIESLRENWNDAATFVNPNDSEMVRQALDELIKNPWHRRKLADAARTRALALSPQRMAEAYFNIYETLRNAYRSAAPAHSAASSDGGDRTGSPPARAITNGHDHRASSREQFSRLQWSPLRVVMFYHSLISDWNHGNAHFLRGIVTELQARGHHVAVYEPHDGWSLQNLRKCHGQEAIDEFHSAYPHLHSTLYELDQLDLDEALADADLVIVHEWNDHELIARLGEHRARRGGYRLLFHDTHHRSVTDPQSMARYDLTWYDGVLAFGNVIRDIYLTNRWTRAAWTWHEAADVRVYRPLPVERKLGDLIWIGNWGDEERSAELREFLINPVKDRQLQAKVYGVRYPDDAIASLHKANIEYGGWIPASSVPRELSNYRLTVHVPRRPYIEQLPGIPTIRIFEALACGVPLVCSPWRDSEQLFTPGRDFLVAETGKAMKQHLRALLDNPNAARQLAEHGRQTILARHTCAHRVDELMSICRSLGMKADRRRRSRVFTIAGENANG